MSEETKVFYKMITETLSRASNKLSDKEFLDLCAEVENISNAEYEARKEQQKNKEVIDVYFVTANPETQKWLMNRLQLAIINNDLFTKSDVERMQNCGLECLAFDRAIEIAKIEAKIDILKEFNEMWSNYFPPKVTKAIVYKMTNLELELTKLNNIEQLNKEK